MNKHSLDQHLSEALFIPSHRALMSNKRPAMLLLLLSLLLVGTAL